MARKSTGKTTSKRKPAKAKKTLGARTRAKKSTKPAAKKKVAKKSLEVGLQTLTRQEETPCQDGDQEEGIKISIGTTESCEEERCVFKEDKSLEAPDKGCSPQSEHDTC